MIEFLLLAGLVAQVEIGGSTEGQVGVVRSIDGEQIDFGPGAQCMFTLPDGFLVLSNSSDEFLIRFDNREKDQEKLVRGTARVLDKMELEERLNAPKSALRKYKNATIETAVSSRDGITVRAFEVVIGRQVIAFNGLSTAPMPKPEDVVDACGSPK